MIEGTFNLGVAASIWMGTYNGQGLGVTSGKLTEIISHGGGNDRAMGSEWLTSIFTSSITLRVVTNCYNLVVGYEFK